MDIILASTSQRRQQLLSTADLDFVTYKVEVNEEVRPDEAPQDYIVRMVEAKSQQAYQQLYQEGQLTELNYTAPHQPKLIITADTIGVLADGSTILVKPTDKKDAFAMWQKMSGSRHAVWTAVQLTIVDAEGNIKSQNNILEKTDVHFICLTQEEMQWYWETGEPIDKAGGYAIQGKGAAWVKRIEGSYTNVVGLPLAQTLTMIKRLTNEFKMTL